MLRRQIRIQKIANSLKYRFIKKLPDIPSFEEIQDQDQVWEKLKAHFLSLSGEALEVAKRYTNTENQFIDSDEKSEKSPQSLAKFIDDLENHLLWVEESFDEAYSKLRINLSDKASKRVQDKVKGLYLRAKHIPELVENSRVLEDLESFNKRPFTERGFILSNLVESAKKGTADIFEESDFITTAITVMEEHGRDRARFVRDYDFVKKMLGRRRSALLKDLREKLKYTLQYLGKNRQA